MGFNWSLTVTVGEGGVGGHPDMPVVRGMARGLGALGLPSLRAKHRDRNICWSCRGRCNMNVEHVH